MPQSLIGIVTVEGFILCLIQVFGIDLIGFERKSTIFKDCYDCI